MSSNTSTVQSVPGVSGRTIVSGLANVVIDIDSNYAGQSSISTLGTVTQGAWEGSPVKAHSGGTGMSGPFNVGDTIYANGNDSFAALPIGQEGLSQDSGFGSASMGYTHEQYNDECVRNDRSPISVLECSQRSSRH